ncbi:hypothetical protein K3495_g7334 [Podosphaera aphanis]|nr:hypothetical protein K3495_g7334 [Podosphaera aphanis]
METPDFELFSTVRYDPVLRTQAANTTLITGSEASPFYMLPYHRDRILHAAQHFGWSHAAAAIQGTVGLAFFMTRLDLDVSRARDPAPLRIKVRLNAAGQLHVEQELTAAVDPADLYPQQLDTWTTSHATVYMLCPVVSPTCPDSHTRYKTTQRRVYDMARRAAGISSLMDAREALLINSGGEVMEGSLTSVYFWREGRWVTPALTSGGQQGTTRRWALEHGCVLSELSWSCVVVTAAVLMCFRLCVEEIVPRESLVDGERCWISNGLRGFQRAVVACQGAR